LFPEKKNTRQSASHNELRFSVLSRGGQPYRLRGPLAVSALRKGNLHVKLLPLVQLHPARGEPVHRVRPSSIADPLRLHETRRRRAQEGNSRQCPSQGV